MADGAVSDHWEPTSPVDGRLDAFQWRVPVETTDTSRREILARRLEELTAIEPPAESGDGSSERPTHTESKVSDGDADVIDAEPITTRKDNGTLRRPADTTSREEPATRGSHSVRGGKPGAASGETQGKQTRRATNGDSSPFVAPHAPDDPGTEPEEAEQEPEMAGRNVRIVS
jgi:HemY protein